MRTSVSEKGFALAMALILLGLGGLIAVPTLQLAFASAKGKQVHTSILKDQYARDGAAEFGVWQLQYGDATQLLNDPDECPDSTCSYPTVLNGISTDVTVRMLTELGSLGVPGAEDNKIRTIVSVECDENGSGNYGDDCLSLPSGLTNMVARYTVELNHISPDTSTDLEYVYGELPIKFDFREGTVDSPDSSFTEILTITPENIGSSQEQILKWDFSSAPVSFEQNEVKTFRFEANIEKSANRYCTGVFLKLEQPPTTPPDGCNGGGILTQKFVDQLVAVPMAITIFTYIANIEVFENNSLKLDSIKDVLPHDGFQWCDPANPPDGFSCDDPMYKIVDDPFNPVVDSFTDTTGFSVLDDPVETFADGRWELFWDNGGLGWNLAQAGQAGDTFTLRFQAHVTPDQSGSYYNELFAAVNCSAPSNLIQEGVTSQEEYCQSYSWPTGGTLVPMYDVNSAADLTHGQGNVTVGINGAVLESWHVENK
jgi:hypothetical protein